MKKLVIGLVAVCLIICMLSFVGCGGSIGKTEEDQFNEAKEKFENYTVDVTIQYAGGDKYVSTLMCDGQKGMLTLKSPSESVVYFSEDYGKVFYYEDENKEWNEDDSASTIEEATSDLNGYVFIIQTLFFDDFTKDGEYFVAKQSALSAYSEEYGIEMQSVKVKLESSKFVSATAIVEYFGSRLEVQYSFSNYGNTKVNLPE